MLYKEKICSILVLYDYKEKGKFMQHLITTSDFTNDEIIKLFDEASSFKELFSNFILSDKLIVTLFFENSTRTRSSFEIAAKRLGASVINLEVQTSSTKKGETVEDTVANLNAMKPDAIIIRHSKCGLPASLIEYVNCPIINAGDGMNAHPTQALLDLFTIYKHFHKNINNKNIAIVGDIASSRVASSNLRLLPRFGLNIILVSPKEFKVKSGFPTTKSIKEVIDDIDIIMSLRVQHERHTLNLLPQELNKRAKKYAKKYCITKELMKDREILLLHPGPVNRNIDISDDILKDKRCKVLEQVTNGVCIRMAILKKLILKQ
jgi:aspartate carbamoyltransferase catalytic subunit